MTNNTNSKVGKQAYSEQLINYARGNNVSIEEAIKILKIKQAFAKNTAQFDSKAK